MTVATVFKNNQSQAVRLPKAVAFPETVKQVDVQVVGNMRILSPVGTSWDYFFDHVEVPDDFMNEREQPEAQEREQIFD